MVMISCDPSGEYSRGKVPNVVVNSRVKISGPETNDVTFFPEHLEALIAVLHEAKKFLDEHDNADE